MARTPSHRRKRSMKCSLLLRTRGLCLGLLKRLSRRIRYTTSIPICSRRCPWRSRSLVTSRNSSATRIRIHGNLFQRIFQLIIFPHEMLPSPLRHHMLHQCLLGHFFHKLPDEPRIPQFRRNAQILTATHESIRFTPFCSSRNSIGVKVLLFAAGYRHEPVISLISNCTLHKVRKRRGRKKKKGKKGKKGFHSPSPTNQSILPRHQLPRHNSLPSRRQSPAPRSKRAIQFPAILDFRQIHNPIRFDFNVVEFERLL